MEIFIRICFKNAAVKNLIFNLNYIPFQNWKFSFKCLRVLKLTLKFIAHFLKTVTNCFNLYVRDNFLFYFKILSRYHYWFLKVVYSKLILQVTLSKIFQLMKNCALTNSYFILANYKIVIFCLPEFVKWNCLSINKLKLILKLHFLLNFNEFL